MRDFSLRSYSGVVSIAIFTLASNPNAGVRVMECGREHERCATCGALVGHGCPETRPDERCDMVYGPTRCPITCVECGALAFHYATSVKAWRYRCDKGHEFGVPKSVGVTR